MEQMGGGLWCAVLVSLSVAPVCLVSFTVPLTLSILAMMFHGIWPMGNSNRRLGPGGESGYISQIASFLAESYGWLCPYNE